MASTAESSPELKRRLTQRQLTMMTIGGAIGVGLFLGSSVTIRLAGPGVILSYLFSAVIALIVAYSIAEMAVVHPVAGSFGVYAQTYLNEWSGFAVRVTYAFVQIIAIGAEVTAVAIYFSIWFPAVPQWIWVVGVSVGLIAINAMQVGNFAEFEYWFAIIKVIAIVAFILVGLGLIFGLGPVAAVGFSNLTAHGGFLPQWTEGRLAGHEPHAYQLHGRGDHRRHGRRGCATGKDDSARHAHGIASAHSLLCALDHRDALDDAVGQDGQRPHRQSVCAGLRDGWHSICRGAS